MLAREERDISATGAPFRVASRLRYANGRLGGVGRGPTVSRVLASVVGGAVIAGGVALIMAGLKPVWTVLLLLGSVVLLGAAIVKDARLYWLALFLLALPLNIHKNFAQVETVLQRVEAYGAPWGATTPLLHLSDLPLLVLLGMWCVRVFSKKERFYLPAMSYLPLGFLVWSSVGLLFSPYPVLTSYELIRQYKFVLIYIFTINMVDPKRMVRVIALALLAGLLVQGSYTLVRYGFQVEGSFLGDTFGDESERFVPSGTITGESSDDERGEGTFGHPNATGLHLEFVLPLAMLLFLSSPRVLERVLGLGLFGLGLVALYVTFSRGALVGFLVGGLVVLMVACYRGVVSKVVLAMALLAAFTATPVAIGRLASYLSTRPEAFEERFVHWEVGLKMVGFNPITGTGLNTSTAVRQQFSFGSSDLIDSQWPLHNHYLIGLIETGAVGVALYVGFFIWVTLEAYRRSRSRDFWESTFSLVVLGAYTALAVHMTVDFLNHDALHTLLWFYAGLIVAMRRNERGVDEEGSGGLPRATTGAVPGRR